MITNERQLNEIVGALGRGMTVGQLIEELKQYDKDAVVVYQSCYGDHTRTQQALLVEEVADAEDEMVEVETTAYSHSGLCLRDRSEEDEESDDPDERAAVADFQAQVRDTMPKVVILR